jgi:hypothetical protein
MRCINAGGHAQISYAWLPSGFTTADQCHSP